MRRPSITAAPSTFTHLASLVVDDGLSVSVVHINPHEGRRFVANLSKVLDEIDASVERERLAARSLEVPQPQGGHE